MSGGLARAIEAVLWILAGAVAVWLAVRVFAGSRVWWKDRGSIRAPELRPNWRFRRDEPPVPGLPDNPAREAEALLAQGRVREAVSLLYRGAVGYLLDRGCTVAAGATEGEVLSVARDACRREALAPQAVTYIEQLLGLWQGIAYAARAPCVDEIQPLCARWFTALPSDKGGQ